MSQSDDEKFLEVVEKGAWAHATNSETYTRLCRMVRERDEKLRVAVEALEVIFAMANSKPYLKNRAREALAKLRGKESK